MDYAENRLYSLTEMDTLLAAAHKGDTTEIERHLRPNVDIDTRGGMEALPNEHIGPTMLEKAARYGQLETMRYLIRNGANVKLQFEDDTVLLSAAYQGNVQVCDFLMENGADVSRRRFRGSSVLHEAVADISADNLDRKISVVKSILNFGFNIDTTDEDGYTALHWVAWSGCLQIVEILISKGANVDGTDPGSDRPLDRVAAQGHLDIVEFLLGEGAQVNAEEGGCKGLGGAALGGYTAMVLLLLEHGAKAIKPQGMNFELLLAARSGNAETVSLLYERGFAHQGPRSLHIATLIDPLSVVELLLAQDIDINSRNKKGQTILHAAILRRPLDQRNLNGIFRPDVEVLKRVLNRGADTEAKDKREQTAKDLAIVCNNMDAVRILEMASHSLDLLHP